MSIYPRQKLQDIHAGCNHPGRKARVGGRRMRRPLFDHTVPNLLVVAAVSGSGKSTFIQNLKARRLPPEILEALPEDCSNWVAIDKQVPRWQRFLGRREPAAGQVRECDVTYMWARQKENEAMEGTEFSIEQVPELSQQLQVSRNIFAVMIWTPQSQLVEQLAKRSVLSRLPPFLRKVGVPAADFLLRLESMLPEALPTYADKFLGRKWRKRTAIRQCDSKLLRLYSRGGIVNEIQRQFEKSLRDACGPRARAILHIEPSHYCRFRLIRDSVASISCSSLPASQTDAGGG